MTCKWSINWQLDHMRYLAIILVAVAVTVPLWIVSPQTHDSYWIDVVWLDQFSDQLRAGYLYPRWLPDSHHGLGSPVFYYYPPLAFYLAAIPNLLGISDYSSVIVAFGIASAASGAAMYVWLKDISQQPLLGALVYMVLPYHLFDFYARGALAEFSAIAFLPLIALGMNRRPPVLALAYAGIIVTHLPLALLTSFFLIVPYGLRLFWDDCKNAMPIVAGLVCGLLISSLYLLPALTLAEFRKGEELYRLPHLIAANWNFFSPAMWPKPEEMPAIIALTTAPIIGCCLLIRQGFWPLLAIGVGLIVAGVLEIWSIPLLAKVQFPWRALPIAEFGLATAFAMTPRSWLAPIALAPCLILSPLTAFYLKQNPSPPLSYFYQRDVSEYLPANVPRTNMDYAAWAYSKGRAKPSATFYFPSLGSTKDGIFLEGAPDLKTLTEEWIGLFFTFSGLLGLACLRTRFVLQILNPLAPETLIMFSEGQGVAKDD